MSLVRLAVCSFLTLSFAVEVDPQLAPIDDECSVEGEKCSLQVLQMKGRKLAAQEDCTGSGILPAGKDLCYEGQLLVETFKVKVLDNDGSSGSLNMQAIGPLAGQCDGVAFQMSGSQVTANDLSSCGIQGAEYDMSWCEIEVKYCSDQDQFVVQITKPMTLDVVLARGSCGASFVAMPSPHHPVALLAQEMQGEVSAALQDCGEGPMPAGISCYEGQLLVETFKVKVTNSDGTSGSLDMKAVGPLAGQCDGVQFQKDGSQLTAANLNSCGINGAEYDVKYCSNTDQFVVQITKPMTLDVVLARSTCDASLAAVAGPHPAALVAQESQRYCSGYGGLPKGTLCYGGTFLVEKFFVKVHTYSSSSGRVDVKASGPKNGSCYGVSFRKSGQYISLNYAKCGFSGLKFSVLYCSNQDSMKVHVTAPIMGDVMLSRKSCR